MGPAALTNALGGCLAAIPPLELWGFPSMKRKDGMANYQFGLADKARQWASTLSRGERQRLAICRTLLSYPHSCCR